MRFLAGSMLMNDLILEIVPSILWLTSKYNHDDYVSHLLWLCVRDENYDVRFIR